MDATLTELQESVVHLLQSIIYFIPVPIFNEKRGDIDSQVEIRLAKNTGICAIVITPSASSTKPAAPGPILDDVSLVVQVAENVLINQGSTGTKLPASDVAEQVAAHLHLKIWAKGKTLMFERIRLSPVEKGPLVYNVTFKTSAVITKK